MVVSASGTIRRNSGLRMACLVADNDRSNLLRSIGLEPASASNDAADLVSLMIVDIQRIRFDTSSRMRADSAPTWKRYSTSVASLAAIACKSDGINQAVPDLMHLHVSTRISTVASCPEAAPQSHAVRSAPPNSLASRALHVVPPLARFWAAPRWFRPVGISATLRRP
jgi:hypothetical protein